MPASCAVVSHGLCRELSLRKCPREARRVSTESIQKRKPAEKNTKRYPEVNVGSDSAQKVTGRTADRFGQYCDLVLRVVNLDFHLRDTSGESQRAAILAGSSSTGNNHSAGFADVPPL